MSSVKDVSCIPTAGINLIILAVANDVLHFRIFDGDGDMVVDTDSKRLPEQAQPIENLRRRLETLWRPHELTESEKVRVITSVASIVGHTVGPLASVTSSGFHRSPAELSNDSAPDPLIYGLLGASWAAVFVLVAVLVASEWKGVRSQKRESEEGRGKGEWRGSVEMGQDQWKGIGSQERESEE